MTEGRDRPPMTRAPRILEIDGIRGWAALAVVVFHTLQEVFGAVVPAVLAPGLRLFMDGPLAVYIFFVLSGDALSSAFVSGNDVHALDRVIAKRYFRLAIPVLLSVLATYAVMALGLTYNRDAAVLVRRDPWLGSFLTFDPTLSGAVGYALFGVFGGTATPAIYNTFLWTMPIELVGSLLVFSYLHIIHRLRHPVVVTLFLIVVAGCLSEFYDLFFFGILLAQLRAGGTLDRLRRSAVGWVGGLLLILAAYCLEVYYFDYPAPDPASTELPALVETVFRNHEKTVLAVLLVCGSYVSLPALWFFRCGISMFLGRISFALYLLQFPVICSFESYLITTHPASVAAPAFVAAAAGGSVLLTIVLATLFSRVDDLALRSVSGWIKALFVARSDKASDERLPEAPPTPSI